VGGQSFGSSAGVVFSFFDRARGPSEERERGLREAVLKAWESAASIPPKEFSAFAKSYVEIAVGFVSGVTGAKFKKRSHAILTRMDAEPSNLRKKKKLAPWTAAEG